MGCTQSTRDTDSKFLLKGHVIPCSNDFDSVRVDTNEYPKWTRLRHQV